jgi:hypothetical protein
MSDVAGKLEEAGAPSVRPDLGLNISIFGHIMEYYGSIGLKGAMPPESILDRGVLAETIGNMWLERIAKFDKVAESVKEAEIEYQEMIEDLTEQVSTLTAELESNAKPAKKAKAKATEVANEEESQ